jgi:hypothetical protein
MALFNIYTESKVYVLCPAGAVTGGPEALHQLAYKLRRKGIDARMVYYSDNNRDTEVPEPYRVYDPVVSDEVEDEQANVVIVP